ncbi:MAG: redoxin domain-containing protein, partial [Ferruginibacter sp.]
AAASGAMCRSPLSSPLIPRALWRELMICSGVVAQVPAATVPDFKFSKPDQTVFTAKDLAKGKLLFFVFFDTECEHCQHAISYLNQHFRDFKNAAIYLINLEGQGKTDLFIAKYGGNLRRQKNILFLRDFQNDFILKFKPRKYPSLFLYSSTKKLLLYDDEEKNMVNFLNKVKGNIK